MLPIKIWRKLKIKRVKTYPLPPNPDLPTYSTGFLNLESREKINQRNVMKSQLKTVPKLIKRQLTTIKSGTIKIEWLNRKNWKQYSFLFGSRFIGPKMYYKFQLNELIHWHWAHGHRPNVMNKGDEKIISMVKSNICLFFSNHQIVVHYALTTSICFIRREINLYMFCWINKFLDHCLLVDLGLEELLGEDQDQV